MRLAPSDRLPDVASLRFFNQRRESRPVINGFEVRLTMLPIE
jgi:hypothetical protein